MVESTECPASIKSDVSRALAEDVGTGDISAALIDRDLTANAEVVTRDAGVFCGRPYVDEVCTQIDPAIQVHWQVGDGDELTPDQVLFGLQGPARSLLTAERTLLNFVQLLSGTASQTRHYVRLIEHTDAVLLDTRKTLPGLRAAQKYAVRCGGGSNHRMGLYDAYLIKENHVAAAGSIAAAVRRARALHADHTIEVEVEDLDELTQAIEAGVDIALLDNFNLADTAKAVARAQGRVKLEASGGIDENSIVEIADAGVDYVSVGQLTKNVAPLDLSMRFVDSPSTG
ncbi:MAG: carboxylating nicotinate-nucleotide diphosphorylase [Pseudomonadales bacterium]